MLCVMRVLDEYEPKEAQKNLENKLMKVGEKKDNEKCAS